MGPYYSSLGLPVGWQNSPPARVLTEFSHQEGEAPLPAENRAHLYWRAWARCSNRRPKRFCIAFAMPAGQTNGVGPVSAWLKVGVLGWAANRLVWPTWLVGPAGCVCALGQVLIFWSG